MKHEETNLEIDEDPNERPLNSIPRASHLNSSGCRSSSGTTGCNCRSVSISLTSMCLSKASPKTSNIRHCLHAAPERVPSYIGFFWGSAPVSGVGRATKDSGWGTARPRRSSGTARPTSAASLNNNRLAFLDLITHLDPTCPQQPAAPSVQPAGFVLFGPVWQIRPKLIRWDPKKAC